ncbi:15643_t:CDS:2 [Acaulospora colombiana]|uniref:15643_t:CDS:1 n=1 Tax=Acaulospora colombiana TaxID=27376 RepID=A0ACA9K7A7_9GLOM|nr:15643_t:CDS:2 [Acaulospora colombiana]
MSSEKHFAGQLTIKQTQPSPSTSNSLAKAATIPSELILQIFKYVSSNADLNSDVSLQNLLDTLQSTPQTFSYSLLIRRLNFSFMGESVGDTTLARLSSCERLERLTLGGCRRLTDAGLLKLLEKTDGLVALDVSDIENLTDKVIKLVGERCRRLQGLNVSLCKGVTDAGIIEVASRCRSLRRIKLSSCENITDESVIVLAENCQHLLELDLTNCHQITNKAIQPVFENCTQLRELRLACCANLTDDSFIKTIPSMFEQLRVLDLASCALITDRTIYTIVHSAPKLRNLVLAKCGNITDEGVYHITKLGRHLHYLHLGHCWRITDHSITHLARYCNRLRYLDLACCNQLTDSSVFELSNLQKLRRIGLVKCALITDQAIYSLIGNRVVAYTLERVHLSYCVNLTIAAVLDLVNFCYRLTHLSLTGVPAFLRQDVQRYCRQPPKEFTIHQRQVFCVFSGKGVKELKNYLNHWMTNQSRRAAAAALVDVGEQNVPQTVATVGDIDESVASEPEGAGGDISEGGEGENDISRDRDNNIRQRIHDTSPDGDDGLHDLH